MQTLSKGDPKGMNCSSFRSRKRRLVVSSNFRVIWSSESGVPYFEFLSLSDIERDENENNEEKTNNIPSRNSLARLLTNTDPAKMPENALVG